MTGIASGIEPGRRQNRPSRCDNLPGRRMGQAGHPSSCGSSPSRRLRRCKCRSSHKRRRPRRGRRSRQRNESSQTPRKLFHHNPTPVRLPVRRSVVELTACCCLSTATLRLSSSLLNPPRSPGLRAARSAGKRVLSSTARLEPAAHAGAAELGARAVRVFGGRDGFDAGAHFIEVGFARTLDSPSRAGLNSCQVAMPISSRSGLCGRESGSIGFASWRHRPPQF